MDPRLRTVLRFMITPCPKSTDTCSPHRCSLARLQTPRAAAVPEASRFKVIWVDTEPCKEEYTFLIQVAWYLFLTIWEKLTDIRNKEILSLVLTFYWIPTESLSTYLDNTGRGLWHCQTPATAMKDLPLDFFWKLHLRHLSSWVHLTQSSLMKKKKEKRKNSNLLLLFEFIIYLPTNVTAFHQLVSESALTRCLSTGLDKELFLQTNFYMMEAMLTIWAG